MMDQRKKNPSLAKPKHSLTRPGVMSGSIAQEREALKQELLTYGLRQEFVEEVLSSTPDADLPFADVGEYMDIKLVEHAKKWDKWDRDQGEAAWEYGMTHEFCAAVAEAEYFASQWLGDIMDLVYLDRR